jgi:cytochrome c5
MNKILAITASVFLAATIFTMIAMPSQATGSVRSSNPSQAVPDSVGAIFEKSCFPCHASPGNGMAMTHLNFDKWDTYSSEKQAGKAQDIVKELTKGAMPPKSFRKNNPDKVPTDVQVQTVSNWAKAIAKK